VVFRADTGAVCDELLRTRTRRGPLYVATSDINLQTKVAAVQRPFIEPAVPSA
jgi:hypothetical protein